MHLIDSHVHCAPFSHDAFDTISDLAHAAAAKGIGTLYITDHIDDCSISDPDKEFHLYFKNRLPRLEAVKQVQAEVGDLITIRLGAELSAMNQTPDLAKTIAASEEYDFVIGSVHSLGGKYELCLMEYESEDQCRQLYRDYILEYMETVELGLCDVLAHIGYAHRYMLPQGYNIDLMEFEELFRTLFTAAAQRGIGLEVNTSGLRSAINRTFPHLPLIKLYRECGGEIVTVGSDAHCTKDVGTGIKEAYDVIREAGFRYVAAFKERKPEFISII